MKANRTPPIFGDPVSHIPVWILMGLSVEIDMCMKAYGLLHEICIALTVAICICYG